MQILILTAVATIFAFCSEQIIAGEKRNGGDLILGYFIEGADLAIDYLDRIDTNEVKIPNNIPPEIVAKGFDKDRILSWFQQNKEALRNDIKSMSFEAGKPDQTFCAQTGSSNGDVVYIRSDLCSPEVNSAVDAAWLIIGEATHHLNSDRSNWEQTEENAFAAFQVIIARQNWNSAKIVLRDDRSCAESARISSALKHAIENGDLNSVKYIIEKKKFDFLLGYVDLSCKVTGFPVDDALAVGQWTEPDYWYRSHFDKHINVFKYLVSQGANVPASVYNAVDRLLNFYNLSSSLIAPDSDSTYFKNSDAVFEILIASDDRSEQTCLDIASYVYGFDRKSLYQKLEQIVPKPDLKEVALHISRKTLFRNGVANFSQLLDRGLAVDQELATKILLGSLRKAHRTDAKRTLSIIDWLIPLGADVSGDENSQEIFRTIAADAKYKYLQEEHFLNGFSSLLENSSRLGLNWSVPLQLQYSKESFTIFDILFFYSKMHQNSYDVFKKFEEPLYSEPHQERLKILSKALELMRSNGISGSGKCYAFEVPSANTAKEHYTIYQTGPQIISYYTWAPKIKLPEVLTWNYYDTTPKAFKNKAPPVSLKVCSK